MAARLRTGWKKKSPAMSYAIKSYAIKAAGAVVHTKHNARARAQFAPGENARSLRAVAVTERKADGRNARDGGVARTSGGV